MQLHTPASLYRARLRHEDKTWKGLIGDARKGDREKHPESLEKVDSGYFQGVFRVLSGCFFPIPFAGIPFPVLPFLDFFVAFLG